MIAPVFAREWLSAGRRRRAYVLRWIFGALLIAQLLLAFSVYAAEAQSPGALADFAIQLLDLVIVEQFVFVALVTPGLVAGTIADEKSSGTLELLLTSRLDPLSIVLGKLAARWTDVLVLTLAALPVVAFLGGLAGMPPAFIFGQAVVTILTAFGLSCVSLLASVWMRSTRAAALVIYFLIVIGVAAVAANWRPISGWLQGVNPVFALAPARDSSDLAEFLRRLGRMATTWAALGSMSIGVAAWRLRPAYIRQLAMKPRGGAVARWFRRPPPNWNPCQWKERFIGRRIPLWVSLPALAGLTSWWLWSSLTALRAALLGAPFEPAETLIPVGWFVLAVLMLTVAVHASGVVTLERERRTWDGLLTSPMSFHDVLQGKLRGVLAGAWPFVVTYILAAAITTAAVMHDGARMLLPLIVGSVGIAALVAVWVPRTRGWVFLALAIVWAGAGGMLTFYVILVTLACAWLTMEFVASIGVWCSVRCASTWRSLLLTALLTLGGGSALALAGAPAGCLATLLGALVFIALGTVFGSADFDAIVNPSDALLAMLPLFVGLGIGVVYWLVARSLMLSAEMYLSRTERIRPGRTARIDAEVRSPKSESEKMMEPSMRADALEVRQQGSSA